MTFRFSCYSTLWILIMSRFFMCAQHVCCARPFVWGYTVTTSHTHTRLWPRAQNRSFLPLLKLKFGNVLHNFIDQGVEIWNYTGLCWQNITGLPLTLRRHIQRECQNSFQFSGNTVEIKDRRIFHWYMWLVTRSHDFQAPKSQVKSESRGVMTPRSQMKRWSAVQMLGIGER